MEAILGCPVYAGERSFTTEPLEDPKAFPVYEEALENNLWFNKYMEFIVKLVKMV